MCTAFSMAFYVGVGDPNSGPHAYVASALTDWTICLRWIQLLPMLHVPARDSHNTQGTLTMEVSASYWMRREDWRTEPSNSMFWLRYDICNLPIHAHHHHCGGKGPVAEVWGGWSYWVLHQETEMEVSSHLSSFVLCSPGTSVHGTVSPTFRLSLPTSHLGESSLQTHNRPSGVFPWGF